jgi:hypothetical protein
MERGKLTIPRIKEETIEIHWGIEGYFGFPSPTGPILGWWLSHKPYKRPIAGANMQITLATIGNTYLFNPTPSIYCIHV